MNEFLEDAATFFAASRQKSGNIAYRTDDGKNVGKIRFYCKALEVSRQAFYDYLKRKEQP